MSSQIGVSGGGRSSVSESLFGLETWVLSCHCDPRVLTYKKATSRWRRPMWPLQRSSQCPELVLNVFTSRRVREASPPQAGVSALSLSVRPGRLVCLLEHHLSGRDGRHTYLVIAYQADTGRGAVRRSSFNDPRWDLRYCDSWVTTMPYRLGSMPNRADVGLQHWHGLLS
ncbi:hypothetical protein B296_00021192 [Ensete ventricosum]|uniref:Uncharacterized protein n=1 Tax=Ensete ventricosum TaxID=4639 RepID=A0A427B019_ENSVE|nr:hypothetical protein B296_00021192 [Ensete ventricosum]